MPDVVCIGGVNTDLIARVDRFPNPDEEIAISKLEIHQGGSAANVAVGIKRLGYPSGLIGKVGEDIFGDFLLEGLKKEKVDIAYLKKVGGRSGLVFVGVNPKGERILYADQGPLLGREDIPEDYISKAKFLHLTSLIGEETIEAFKFASETAFKARVKVSLDPGMIFAEKGLSSLRDILRHCFLIMPNEIEARILTQREGEEAAKILHSFGAEIVIITQGEKGCFLSFDGSFKHIPACRMKVLDSTGAGDSFAAGFIVGLLRGMGPEGAARFANLVAGLSVEKEGARTTPKLQEVKKLLEEEK